MTIWGLSPYDCFGYLVLFSVWFPVTRYIASNGLVQEYTFPWYLLALIWLNSFYMVSRLLSPYVDVLWAFCVSEMVTIILADQHKSRSQWVVLSHWNLISYIYECSIMLECNCFLLLLLLLLLSSGLVFSITRLSLYQIFYQRHLLVLRSGAFLRMTASYQI